MDNIFSKFSRAVNELTHIFSRKIFIFYWRGSTDSNFGDQLNLDLLRYFGYTPVHSTPGHAEIFAIGSILGYYLDRYDGLIMGSGYIKPPNRISIKPKNVLALRGPLTNNYVKKKNTIMCDPGILSRKIFGEFEKSHQLGVVPHFRDKDDSVLKEFFKKNKDIKIIDVEQKPAEVVKEIARCEMIFSSSLHGLVVADSYNIPAVWINFSDRQTGGEFKFNDYHFSLGIKRTREKITEETTVKSLCQASVRAPYHITENRISGMERVFFRLRFHLVFLRMKRILKRAVEILS